MPYAVVLAALVVAVFWSRRASADVRVVTTESGDVIPRGIRNNNPGNLRDVGIKWHGLTGHDEVGYATFDVPEHGIRAMTKDILNDHVKDGLRTLRELITEYAPPSENKTADYIAFVSRVVQVDPDAPLDLLYNRNQLTALVGAIIVQENGRPERYGKTEWYSSAQVAAGIQGATE